MSSFYHLCVVCIGVGVRGASCWWMKAGISHGSASLTNAKTLLSSVGFCYEYLTHPGIDARFRRIYPLLELKNQACSCVLLRLVDCFIKITHTYSSRERWKWSRDTRLLFSRAFILVYSQNGSERFPYVTQQKETQISAQFNLCLIESTDTSRACGPHVNHVLTLWLPRSGRLPPAVHQNLWERKSRRRPAAADHPPGAGGLGSVQDRPSGAHTGGCGLTLCSGEF